MRLLGVLSRFFGATPLCLMKLALFKPEEGEHALGAIGIAVSAGQVERDEVLAERGCLRTSVTRPTAHAKIIAEHIPCT